MIDDFRLSEFWNFMIERESIRQRRLMGLPRDEWTKDPIFAEYSFTNVKRAHDRTTMLLKAEFYDSRVNHHPSKEALINAASYRYTGTVDAARMLGWMQEWDKEYFLRRIGIMMATGATTFTSAYIVPNCGSTAPKHEVVAEILDGIANGADEILDTDKWEIACWRMCRLYGVGSFMAKEVLLDYILATGWKPSDWETWTPVGPGGRRGAGYLVNGVIKGIGEDEALDVIRKIYADRHRYWSGTLVIGTSDTTLRLGSLPELDLTDIQFQLCELAKYMKVKTGIGRPKHRFRPTVDDITQVVVHVKG